MLIAVCGNLPIHAEAPSKQHDPRRFNALRVVSLASGSNALDIDGDGCADVVFNAYLPTINAHGHAHITFYVRDRIGAQNGIAHNQSQTLWEVVPFVDRSGPAVSWFGTDLPSTRQSFDTVEGADCTLRDLAVLRSPDDPHAAVMVVVTVRDFGCSYADRQHVVFSVYRFERNPDSDAPSFARMDQFRSKLAYCDVDHAMAAELGVAFDPPLQDDGIDH